MPRIRPTTLGIMTKWSERVGAVMPEISRGVESLRSVQSFEQRDVAAEGGMVDSYIFKRVQGKTAPQRATRSELVEAGRQTLIRLESSANRALLKKLPEMLFQMLFDHECYQSHVPWTVFCKYPISLAYRAQEWKRRCLSGERRLHELADDGIFEPVWQEDHDGEGAADCMAPGEATMLCAVVQPPEDAKVRSVALPVDCASAPVSSFVERWLCSDIPPSATDLRSGEDGLSGAIPCTSARCGGEMLLEPADAGAGSTPAMPEAREDSGRLHHPTLEEAVEGHGFRYDTAAAPEGVMDDDEEPVCGPADDVDDGARIHLSRGVRQWDGWFCAATVNLWRLWACITMPCSYTRREQNQDHGFQILHTTLLRIYIRIVGPLCRSFV